MRTALLFSLILVFALADVSGASAEIATQGILDQVLTSFSAKASGWQAAIKGAASWLFWTLTLISMVFTFGFMALRREDISAFLAEFVRFTIFVGFFWWLLENGPTFAIDIVNSLRLLAGQASGVGALSPSSIVDIGFMVFKRAIENMSVLAPVDSIAGLILSIAILLILAAIAINMLLLLIAGWVLAYAGIFFLGFGGSRWTSDMAIGYYRTVLGLAVNVFVFTLLVGVGNDLLSDFYGRMAEGIEYEELAVMLIVGFALFMLTNKVPSMVSGIVSGGGGNGGIGTASPGAVAGAALAAATVAAAGVAGAAKLVGGTAVNAAGGMQALNAAFGAGAETSPDSMGGTLAGTFSDSEPGQAGGFADAAGFSVPGASLGSGRAQPAGFAAIGSGAASMVGSKMTELKTGFAEKASSTVGGRLAAVIREQRTALTSTPSASGAESDGATDYSEEVAAFANKGASNG